MAKKTNHVHAIGERVELEGARTGLITAVGLGKDAEGKLIPMCLVEPYDDAGECRSILRGTWVRDDKVKLAPTPELGARSPKPEA